MVFERFSKLFTWMPRSAIKAGEGLREGQYPFYTSGSRQTKRIDKPLYLDEAIIFGTGGSASVHYENGHFAVSTECVVARKKANVEVNTKYVYYFLLANINILEKGFRGAGLRHISKAYIDKIDIPILPREAQDRIVVTLDKVQSLIDKRDETIKNLDKLLLSLYLKMFGKANSDFYEWDEVDVAYYQKSIRPGPFGSSLKHDVFKEQGDVIVLGIDNAVENTFRIAKKRYITNEEYQSFRNYTVHARDVIITLMGTVGRSAVIPEGLGPAINTKHNTYGASVDFILRNFFNASLVSAKSLSELKDVIERGNIDDLQQAIDKFGESYDKQFLFKRIYEKMMQEKDDSSNRKE